ncbi:MAG: fumarate hydratase [Candidatus Omnitrophica bacterium]|nr:fumarate hydratase [Candidatus Omnitrophota bacterium]
MVRIITSDKIRETVRDLCIKANVRLRPDVLAALKNAYRIEADKRAKRILRAILDNAAIARKESLAVCQDTGLPFVMLGIGQEARITGDLTRAVNKGVEQGYRRGYFRESIVRDPLMRGASGYSPAVIHTEIIRGNKVKIAVLPKGFGSENKSQSRMFNPTAGIDEIKKFVVESVITAGPDACPPYVVGVGIGGTADYASFLAKKALLRSIFRPASRVPAGKAGGRPTGHIKNLEHDLLRRINGLNIGPMGLGGRSTCLGVNIETSPTHIAGLPVAVNISCHALRSARASI